MGWLTGGAQATKAPFERNTKNTYGFESFDPNNQFVKDYMDTPTNVDPGAARRTDLREQENSNRWNNAFTAGLPAHVRMALQDSEGRKIQSEGAYEQQQAEYNRNQLELAKRSRLLPQLVQTGGQQSGYDTSVTQRKGLLSSIIDAAGPAAAAFAFSDERLKQDIEPQEGVLDRLDDFQAKEWDWKDGSGHAGGVVAQDMEEDFPETVVPGDEQTPAAVNYANIAALALQGVKELRDELNAQKRKRV